MLVATGYNQKPTNRATLTLPTLLNVRYRDLLLLTSKQTDCLAKETCNIPLDNPQVSKELIKPQSSCAPGSGCR
ncbi:MAG: DUF6428 family protein [bacterium]